MTRIPSHAVICMVWKINSSTIVFSEYAWRTASRSAELNPCTNKHLDCSIVSQPTTILVMNHPLNMLNHWLEAHASSRIDGAFSYTPILKDLSRDGLFWPFNLTSIMIWLLYPNADRACLTFIIWELISTEVNESPSMENEGNRYKTHRPLFKSPRYLCSSDCMALVA